MSRNNNNTLNVLLSNSFIASAGALACALVLSGCAGSNSVSGSIEAIDKREGTLLAADLESANGTYGAGCTDRTGSWSVEIEIGAALDHDPLSVVLNNDACVLTLTELRTTGGVLAAEPSIALTTSYKMAPSAFDDPAVYYANAKLDSVSFASDFVLTLLYSDDPALATDDNTATFEVVESSAVGDSVSAPDYMIDPDGLNIVVDDDQIVVSATGSVGLTEGAVTGQTYVVVDNTGLDTYAELDAAFTGDTPVALGANIPAAKFNLVGEDLDVATKRTLIIANTEFGVASYQAFEITFHPAT